MAARRALLGLLLALPLALSGCGGWTPIYADYETGPADVELRAIKVTPITERIGQKLAIALRDSLNPGGVPTPQLYVLRITLQVLRQDLGVVSQGTATRGRLDVIANVLLTDNAGHQLLSTVSHVAESFDILASGYASIVAEDDARTRAVEELRRDVVTQLTAFLRRHAAGAPPQAGKP